MSHDQTAMMPRKARFQSFKDLSRPDLSAPRIAALREALSKAGVEGLLLPRADVFQGEYLPPSEDRLAFLTGFTGSAGFAIILRRKAALFVDGRYTVQAREQVDRNVVRPVALAETTPDQWLKRNAPAKSRIGYDPALFTERGLKRFERAAEEAGLTLVALEKDPVAAIWSERPVPPRSKVSDHPVAFAGVEASEKLAALQARLTEMRVDALAISECPSVNWLFNIRAGDVPHLPILRAFALVPREGLASLFVDPGRLPEDLRKRLGAICTIIPVHTDGAEEMEAALIQLAKRGASIRLDEETAPIRFANAIRTAGGMLSSGADPIALMKAAKNRVEIEGARAAHLRDGAAMVHFLAWLESAWRSGQITEIDAAIALEVRRMQTGALVDISFGSISAAGPNAALPHYRVTEKSDRLLTEGLYLIDSGGQYRDGTTDITRTIALGQTTPAMRNAYTRVLKGMIAISLAVFPKGTSGAQLDALARLPLWEAGQDFDHGTGHGVGAFLSVHEGPQRLSKLGTTALEPGMILSNEPGYYKEGAFGIRTENLIVVEPRKIPRGERSMFGFETLTLCPIDKRPIRKALLTKREREWLDAYHARVRAALMPIVEAEARGWLEAATAPL